MPVGERFECVPAGQSPDGGSPPDAGTPPDAAADAAPSPDAGDPLIDISNARLSGAGEAGVAELAYVGTEFGVFFDYAVRQGPGCESCRSQIVVGTDAEPLDCVFDDSPGLAGRTGRVDVQLPVPDAPGIHPVRWRRFDALDCDAALEAYVGGGLAEGLVGTLDVRRPIVLTPAEGVRERSPGGTDPYCVEITCTDPDSVALAGGGFFGTGNEEIENRQAEDPRTWRRCIAGERPEVSGLDVNLSIACAAVPAGTVTTRRSTYQTRAGETQRLFAGCAPGEVVLGGGGAWPIEWTEIARRPVDKPNDGIQGWELTGVGPAVDVEVEAYCASSVPQPHWVEVTTRLDPGGQCVDNATCPEGMQVISGGHDAPIPLDVDQSLRRGPTEWGACALNPTRDPQNMTVYALCVPQ